MQKASSAGRFGIVGGAAVPHAPQFFSLPDTEDHDQVERVRVAMARLGADLLDLEPDVVVIASNDHLENFFLHCVPSFVVTAALGGRLVRRPQLRVPGRQRDRPRPRESSPGRRLRSGVQPHRRHWVRVRHPVDVLRDRHVDPIVPIYVKRMSPRSPRASAATASARHSTALAAAGVQAVMMASGGLSHYPGTDRYSHPDLTTDGDVLAPAGGEPAIADHVRRRRAGSHGQRRGRGPGRSSPVRSANVPNHFTQESSWHHDYAVLGWTTSEQPAAEELHYPPVVAERLALSSAVPAAHGGARAPSVPRRPGSVRRGARARRRRASGARGARRAAAPEARGPLAARVPGPAASRHRAPGCA